MTTSSPTARPPTASPTTARPTTPEPTSRPTTPPPTISPYPTLHPTTAGPTPYPTVSPTTPYPTARPTFRPTTASPPPSPAAARSWYSRLWYATFGAASAAAARTPLVVGLAFLVAVGWAGLHRRRRRRRRRAGGGGLYYPEKKRREDYREVGDAEVGRGRQYHRGVTAGDGMDGGGSSGVPRRRRGRRKVGAGPTAYYEDDDDAPLVPTPSGSSGSASDYSGAASASLVESRVTSLYNQQQPQQPQPQRQPQAYRTSSYQTPTPPSRQWRQHGMSLPRLHGPLHEDVAYDHYDGPAAAYRRRRMPSPVHPDPTTNHVVPAEVVLSSTLRRLRSSEGVRLLAHGAQTRAPRVVHLRVLHDCVTWQTETAVPSPPPPRSQQQQQQRQREESKRAVRGALHTIPLTSILYVDVGKRTAALRRSDLNDIAVPDSACLSILTRDGSLDLQAPTVIERDALVSCLCLVLDEVHHGDDGGGEHDWRRAWEGAREEGSSSSVTGSSEFASSSGGGGSGSDPAVGGGSGSGSGSGSDVR